MSVNRVSPLQPDVFTRIFQDEQKAGKAMLEFLNAVLEYAGEEPMVEVFALKSGVGRVEVRGKNPSGHLLDIEVGLVTEHANEYGFMAGARLGAEAPWEGEPHLVRVINLISGSLGGNRSKVVESVGLSFANGAREPATEAFKLYNIQLSVFRRDYGTLESVKGNRLLTWLYALDRGYQSEEEMKALSMMTEGLGVFAREYGLAVGGTV